MLIYPIVKIIIKNQQLSYYRLTLGVDILKKCRNRKKRLQKALKAAGFDVEFVHDSKDKAKFDKLAKKHKVKGFPATIVAGKTNSRFYDPRETRGKGEEYLSKHSMTISRQDIHYKIR